MKHTIDLVSFREGRVFCSCSAVITEPRDAFTSPDDGLVSAWQEHRRIVGAPKSHDGIGWDRDGRPQAFRMRQRA